MYPITEETRKKMRETRKYTSPETRKKMSEAKKGQIPWNKGLTKETDQRIAIVSKRYFGKTYDERYGKEKADALRKQIGSYKKGKTYEEMYGKEKADAIRKRFTLAMKGRKNPPMSEETKQKLREANLGKKQSKETIKKRRETIKRRYTNGYKGGRNYE